MPGLGRRYLSLIETPDLDLVPQRFAPRQDAIFRAGLELGFLHLGIWALSLLVVAGLVRSLAPLAGPLRAIADAFRGLGTGRGGMTVTAEGIDGDGRNVNATWALVAIGQDGPHVPVLPTLALLRKLAGGATRQTGAMPCVGLLTLADIAREFTRFRIVTRVLIRPRALFARALGRSFDTMPAAVRNGHAVDDRIVLEGRASVAGAASLPGRLIARMFGLPGSGADVPVRVEMRAQGSGEIWTRTMGTRVFHSRLRPVAGRRARITERFGPLSVVLELTAGPDGLDLVAAAARLGPLPLPRRLVPRSRATERVDADGRFQFDVPVELPGLGLLVHYRGWLVAVSPGETVSK